MATSRPCLLEVEFMMIARAIAQRRHYSGLFSATNMRVSRAWKKKVTKAICVYKRRKCVPYSIAEKLKAECPAALLKKLGIYDFVEVSVAGASGHLVGLPPIISPPASPSPSPPPRRPSSLPSSPISTARSSPEPVQDSTRSPSPPTPPPITRSTTRDLSTGVFCRQLNGRQLLADWAAKHSIPLAAMTEFLKTFQEHCPQLDFSNLPSTAPTLLKVCEIYMHFTSYTLLKRSCENIFVHSFIEGANASVSPLLFLFHTGS